MDGKKFTKNTDYLPFRYNMSCFRLRIENRAFWIYLHYWLGQLKLKLQWWMEHGNLLGFKTSCKNSSTKISFTTTGCKTKQVQGWEGVGLGRKITFFGCKGWTRATNPTLLNRLNVSSVEPVC